MTLVPVPHHRIVLGVARRYGAGKIPGAEVDIDCGAIAGTVTWQLGEDEPQYDQGVDEWLDVIIGDDRAIVDRYVRHALRGGQ